MEFYKYYLAGFPFICIKTNEYERIEKKIMAQYSTIKYKATWDYEYGFTRLTPSGIKKDTTPIANPSDVLTEIDENFPNHSNGGSIAILRNFDYFLNPSYDGYFDLCQMIINRKEKWRRVVESNGEQERLFKQVIIICNTFPEHLPAEIPVLEFPFLKKGEICTIMNERFSHLRVAIDPYVEEACLGMSEDEIENAIALGLADSKKVDNEGKKLIDVNVISRYKVSRIRKFYEIKQPLPKNMIAGFENAIEYALKRKKAFSDEGQKYGLRYPKIILTVGIWGCGKTLFGRVMGDILGFPVLDLDIGVLYHHLQGKSEENIREAIKIAEAMSPVIVVIDEIGRSMSGMQGDTLNTAPSGEKMFATLLKWVAEKTSPVILYATVNNINKIPTALLRSGRTDIIFFVDIPTLDQRRDIVSIKLKERHFSPSNFDLSALAIKSKGMVGSEIETCINEAMFNRCPKDLQTTDILDEFIKLQPRMLTKTKKQDITNLRTWAKDMAIPASIAQSTDIKTSRLVVEE